MKYGHVRPSRKVVAVAVSVLVAAGGLFTATAEADERLTRAVSIVPTEDAYVSEANPGGKYGRDTTLRMSARAGDQKHAFVKFVVAGIPASATITTAALTFTRDDHHLPATTVRASSVGAAWKADALDYRNAPKVDRALTAVKVNSAQSSFTLDLSRVVVRNGTFAFQLSADVPDDVVRVLSSESGRQGPMLRVTYRTAGAASQASQASPVVPVLPAKGSLSDVWIGAAANTASSSKLAVFDQATQQLGPMTYRRSFDSSLPATFQQSAAAGDAAEGYRSFVSWKPPEKDYVGAARGKYDAEIVRWAKSVPDSGVYATAYHEPENDMTGAQFVALQRHLYAVVKRANPKIMWGSVYMAYWWDKGTSHYIGNPDAWFPGREYADFVGIDIYALDKPTPLVESPRFMHWYNYMSAKKVPIVIAEYGQYGVQDGKRNSAMEAERAKVIAQDAQWIASRGDIVMWLYWHAMGKKNDDWRLQDAGSQKAWAAVAAAGRTD